jgi:hypothetical protein
MVAHACNPSYSEAEIERPTQAKSSKEPISTNAWAWWLVLVIPAMGEK